MSAGVSTTFALTYFSDPENDPVTVAIVSGPSYASISGSSIIINPSTLAIGTTLTTISLSDGVNAAVSYSFNIIVTNLPPALQGAAPATQTVNVGGSLLLDITQPLDPEGGTVTITWASLPSFVTIQSNQWQI